MEPPAEIFAFLILCTPNMRPHLVLVEPPAEILVVLFSLCENAKFCTNHKFPAIQYHLAAYTCIIYVKKNLIWHLLEW